MLKLKLFKPTFLDLIFCFIFIAVIIYLIFQLSGGLSQKAERQRELDIKEAAIHRLEIERQSIYRVITDTDYKKYIEEYTFEQYGYAYPNERRFYDIGR